MTGDAIATLLKDAGPRRPVSHERTERVRAQVHARWLETVAARRRRRYLSALGLSSAIAAAALVIWSVATGLWTNLPSPAAPIVQVGVVEAVTGTLHNVETSSPAVSGGRLFTGSVLETDAEARAALRLSAGPSLRMDVDTRLRITTATTFALERGAVYVDSGPGIFQGQVAIETPYGVARDIGTQFEVRLASEALWLRVREGQVDLSRGERVHDAPAGDELRVATDGSVERRPILPHARQWEWVSRTGPPFPLHGRSLDAFLDWVSRERGWTPRFEDGALAANAATIILEGPVLDTASEEALEVVLPACGLSYRLDGGELWIFDPGGD